MEILAKRLFSFSIIVFNMKLLFEVKKNHLVHPIEVTRSTYCGIVFKLCMPQRYVNNLERYWNNSVCIGVKNFANL